MAATPASLPDTSSGPRVETGISEYSKTDQEHHVKPMITVYDEVELTDEELSYLKTNKSQALIDEA
ncbi:MAG: hypothetical protein QNL62_11910 [Gammaproteobacteria bacterium]|nr:hypothetical protein [Gammaproteobacteria bacterium]